MKITEQSSRFDHLEKMSVSELLQHINEEDYHVAESVRKAIPQIQVLVEAIEKRMKKGGRLFYIGAYLQRLVCQIHGLQVLLPVEIRHCVMP